MNQNQYDVLRLSCRHTIDEKIYSFEDALFKHMNAVLKNDRMKTTQYQVFMGKDGIRLMISCPSGQGMDFAAALNKTLVYLSQSKGQDNWANIILNRGILTLNNFEIPLVKLKPACFILKGMRQMRP